MPTPDPVLIAGAGPTGLVAAAELARRGVPCRLFEKHAAPLPFARASGIQARLLEVFREMGVVEPFLARGTRQDTMVHVWQRAVVVKMFFGEGDTPYPFICGVGEGETIAFLTEHLTSLGVPIERSIEVVSCQQSDGGVRVLLRRDGQDETIDGSHLICCDGTHSAVREQLGDALEGFDYPTRYRTGVMRVENWPFEERDVVLFDDESFAAQTLPDGFKILFDSMDDDDGPVELEQFQRLIDDGLPGRDLRAHDPAWMAAFEVHDRFARTYRVGRVFVAGDAAHAISPINGQGMNLGLDDAYNLAWKLALVIEGSAGEALLDTYESERRPVALASGEASDAKHRARSTRDHAALQKMVDDAIAAAADPQVRRAASQAVGMLDTVYAPSSIVRDERSTVPGGSLPIGGRLPTTLELLEADGARAEVIGRLWDGEVRVLVVRSPNGADDHPKSPAVSTTTLGQRQISITSVIASEPSADVPGDVVFEPAGRLHRSLGFEGDGLVVVRPDGYLSFAADLASISDAPALAARYLATLG